MRPCLAFTTTHPLWLSSPSPSSTRQLIHHQRPPSCPSLRFRLPLPWIGRRLVGCSGTAAAALASIDGGGCSRKVPKGPEKKMQQQQIRDCDKNETEGDGDHKTVLKQKKLKSKTLKVRSTNKGMNSKVDAGGSKGVYDDTVLYSLTTASINSMISRKKMRTHGKVAQQCDAIDPPVPRRLRSAINKRVRHVKKRRHLSAISAQISFEDQQTRLDDTSLLTEEEEVADALLSLSQISSTCELIADKVIVGSTNINASSTSCLEGAAKEGDKTILPSASCIVGRTDSVQHVNSVPGATNHPNNINPSLLEKDQKNDLSLGVAANLPSPCKDSSHNSAQRQLKVKTDDSKNDPAQKPEAPLCHLVNSNKSDDLMHANGKDNENSAQEIMHRVQTPLPCTPDGYLIRPSSSKLAVQANTVSEFSKVTAHGNIDKVPQVRSGVPTKTWKRSITHVYVSHLIQLHLNKEKASQCQVKPEERPPLVYASRSPNGSTTLPKSNNAQDEACYAVRLDVRLPVQQPSTGFCNMSAAAGQQKMVGGNFLNLPTSTAVPGAAQHVQYQYPQIAPRGPMPYPFPYVSHSRANLAPAATLHQMQQYMCNPGYAAARPGLTANSSAMMMKLQQLIPAQQQQMWQQFHVAHQYQPRPDAAAAPGAAWHNNMPSSLLRPTMSMLPTPTMPPPQMELLCAPYQGGGRQPQQLRLI